MRVYEVSVLANGDMTGNLVSNAFQLHQMFGASASCVVTGGSSPAGTLTMTGSVDGTNFTPLQVNNANMTLTVSGDGTYVFDVFETMLQYLQVTYTVGSGSGTLNIDVYSKGF